MPNLLSNNESNREDENLCGVWQMPLGEVGGMGPGVTSCSVVSEASWNYIVRKFRGNDCKCAHDMKQ